LQPGARVAFLERVRSLGGVICTFERIVLPKDFVSRHRKARFAEQSLRVLPRWFCHLHCQSQSGSRRATKRREAECLGVEVGAPLLLVDRIAFDIGGRPVEWRASYCRTDQVHYLADLH
jgi:GntR family transcriptional regulator